MSNSKLNILITGASGFLGQHVLDILSTQPNSEIFTIGRKPSHFNHITADLSGSDIKLHDVSFEEVIHMAGKAHVIPKSIKEIEAFDEINYKGTLSLLRALENHKNLKRFIFASTVAVYGIEQGENVDESQATNPSTAYGISKLKAENAIKEWCNQRNIHFIILRLPLIIGKNPPGNLGNMKKGIEKGFYFRISNNVAKKSVVVAEDIANMLSQQHEVSGIFHLTDGIHPSFNQIETAFEKRLNKKIRITIPYFIIKNIAKIGDVLTNILNKEMPLTSLRLQKITSTLTFDDSKARQQLGWNPSNSLEFIEKKL